MKLCNLIAVFYMKESHNETWKNSDLKHSHKYVREDEFINTKTKN